MLIIEAQREAAERGAVVDELDERARASLPAPGDQDGTDDQVVNFLRENDDAWAEGVQDIARAQAPVDYYSEVCWGAERGVGGWGSSRCHWTHMSGKWY